MPYAESDPLAIPQLFNHLYDIDPLIIAFASSDIPGDWTLDTTTGTVTAPGASTTPAIRTSSPHHPPIIRQNGGTHLFVFSPLPATFHHTLLQHFAFKRLPQDQQQSVTAFINTLATLSDVIPHLNQSFEADFVRERIKEAVVDWLTETDLLPPSMRHLPSAPKTVTKVGKIVIES